MMAGPNLKKIPFIFLLLTVSEIISTISHNRIDRALFICRYLPVFSLRMIYNSSFFPDLTTLLYRRQRYDLIQIFKIVNGLEDIDSESFLHLTII